ncbi:MAG: transporter ATP-binding protein [Rhodospirillales bacterium]|jgi:ABC-2 type transport system ATP-binding protein|nr:transporter ATP-binding protein [Rhodospirillales bacterium]
MGSVDRKDILAPQPTAVSESVSPALEIVGLSHSYGSRTALSDVSFTVSPGDFTVLLGLNGAGKSTLYALITRLYAHRSGTIRVFGAAIDRDPATALARMGIVFQQPTLDLDLSVEQNLRYHAALHGLPRAVTEARIVEELARVEMSDRRRDKTRQLSGGQRRRVEIARALMHRPRLLLLDEPTVGLDVAGRQFLLQHVRKLCRDQGLAVLWATHLIDEVGDDARVIVLHKGKILADGSVPEINAAQGTPSIRAAFDRLVQHGEPSQ